MTVIGWDGASALRHVATISTSPGARIMDIDHRSGRLYLVNADATEFPGWDGGAAVTRSHTARSRAEIGCASCRARVCQYVSLQGVGGSLTRHHTLYPMYPTHTHHRNAQ